MLDFDPGEMAPVLKRFIKGIEIFKSFIVYCHAQMVLSGFQLQQLDFFSKSLRE